MDLNPADGTITITIGGSPILVRTPKVGGYRRLRKELYDIDVKQAAFTAAQDQTLGDGAIRNLATEFHENSLLDWWSLVLVGDPTFVKLTDDTVPERDDWPLELALNSAAISALGFWVGGGPLPSSATPPPDPPTDPNPESTEPS